MSFIHDLPEWPHLRWSQEALTQSLLRIHARHGRHLGKMEMLGFASRSESALAAMTEEIVRSSAIEGEALSRIEVRSSIARRLGLEVAGLPLASRAVEGMVAMMLDAIGGYDLPLTAERLGGWHAGLFSGLTHGHGQITVGAWREPGSGPMQVVSGAMGRERVHFQAPHSERLDQEMRQFLDWFNDPGDLDPFVRAAVAHFWLVTIHPFDDGNGRIARAIADMALARGDGSGERFYSMSARIEAERRDYYLQLESAQRGSTDITIWILWFLGCLERAFAMADEVLVVVLRKARIWRTLGDEPVHARQRLVLNRLLEGWQGHLTTAKYASIAHCSADTALRDIRDLVLRGALVVNAPGGRSTSYQLQPDPGARAG